MDHDRDRLEHELCSRSARDKSVKFVIIATNRHYQMVSFTCELEKQQQPTSINRQNHQASNVHLETDTWLEYHSPNLFVIHHRLPARGVSLEWV